MYSVLHFNTMHCTQRRVTLVLRSVCTMIFTPGEFATKDLHRHSMPDCLGKEHAGFFSAFPQTDAIFGSRGSFFHADWKDFDGAWCVDPPFLEETLSRVDAIVGRWREEGCPPVLFIGPSSYEMKTPFDEEIRLLKGTHFYEGLDGQLHPLPMDVSIWRFGEIEGFDVERIVSGYLPVQS